MTSLTRNFLALMAAGMVASVSMAMQPAEHTAAKERISADYKMHKEKCSAMQGNAKDICMQEAKGAEKVAKAELEAQYRPSDKTQYKARVAHADAAYDVAKEKCDDLTGNAKDVCRKDAKAPMCAPWKTPRSPRCRPSPPPPPLKKAPPLPKPARTPLPRSVKPITRPPPSAAMP